MGCWPPKIWAEPSLLFDADQLGFYPAPDAFMAHIVKICPKISCYFLIYSGLYGVSVKVVKAKSAKLLMCARTRTREKASFNI